jgi:beta-lactamase class D
LRKSFVAALLVLAIAAPATARARMLCVIVSDAADGEALLERGDCRTRVTPASTFKIPLAVMGFDAGILKDAHSPAYPFKEGYPDCGELWRQSTDPTRWLKYSVVWYSQVVARQIGAARLAAYATAFGYGNVDFSGDPGKNNGLDRAWLMSSLEISPREQVDFLRRLVTRRLPVSEAAVDATLRLVEITPAADGWEAHGKTGTAIPRNADGTEDEARGYGWYVGWLTNADRTLLFARLDQDEEKADEPAGVRARRSFLKEWPSLLASSPHE